MSASAWRQTGYERLHVGAPIKRRGMTAARGVAETGRRPPIVRVGGLHLFPYASRKASIASVAPREGNSRLLDSPRKVLGLCHGTELYAARGYGGNVHFLISSIGEVIRLWARYGRRPVGICLTHQRDGPR